MGTFEGPLVLPAVGRSGLAVSSVVVSNQVQEPGAVPRGRSRVATSPLDDNGRKVLPSVTRVFRTDQNLYVYLESYGPKNTKKPASGQNSTSAAGNAAPSSVALVFFRGGAKTSEAGPYAGQPSTATGDTVRYLVRIPLQKFPTGRYWMQVNVLDPADDQVAFARVPLAILKPPPVPASPQASITSPPSPVPQ